jgi:glycine/D-amino acid oxidase-like deaminating enzyme
MVQGSFPYRKHRFDYEKTMTTADALKHDIIIIGGGITGSAAAYFLARSGAVGSIAVIEPDPTYEFATTPQGAGGVRQQFSVAENIEMSRYSLGFFKDFGDHLADIPDLPDIGFTEEG